ncbi:MAG: hypothetical protein ACYDH9_00115 [Limisphaerales bacterium]
MATGTSRGFAGSAVTLSVLLGGCLAASAGDDAFQEKPKVTGFFAPLTRQGTIYEPIFVEFAVTNSGQQEFRFDIGGDYRNAKWRHLRFNFRVVGPGGQALPDPSPRDIGGGMGGPAMIKAGDTYREMIFLNPWADFTTPGKYTVTCQRIMSGLLKQRYGSDQHPDGALLRYDAVFANGFLRAINLAQPGVREELLKRLRPAGPKDPLSDQELEQVVDDFLHFPQITSTFEIEVLPFDASRLRQMLQPLTLPKGTAEYSAWYLEFLGEQLGVSASDYEDGYWTGLPDPDAIRGVILQRFEAIRGAILRKLDEQPGGPARPK